MAAKYTRKPHNVLPKFNFQFSMTSSLLLSTHLVSTHPYHYWHLFITSYFKLLDKSSTVAEMGYRGHNRHGRKEGGCCAPFADSWDPSNTMWPRPRSTSVPSGVFIHPAVWPQQTCTYGRTDTPKFQSTRTSVGDDLKIGGEAVPLCGRGS